MRLGSNLAPCLALDLDAPAATIGIEGTLPRREATTGRFARISTFTGEGEGVTLRTCVLGLAAADPEHLYL